MDSVEVRGTIRLGQFLQVAGLADTGADARALIAAGGVQVDGAVEPRRGRQLHGGEVVAVGDAAVAVLALPADDPA